MPKFPVALAFITYAPALVAQQAEFIALGHLPGATSFPQSRATAISADGTVVAGESTTPVGVRSFRWTAATGMVHLGELPNGASHIHAHGMNADGSVIVGVAVRAPGPDWIGFRWTSSIGLIELPDLPGGSVHAFALDTTADGSRAAGYGTSDQGFEAVTWTGGVPTSLGVPQGLVSFAGAIDADGSTVVGHAGFHPNRVAYAWSATGAFPIPNLPGASQGNAATDVSDDGSVIVGVAYDSDLNHAFRWTAGSGVIGLGTWTEPPAPVQASFAHAISADGRVIVGDGWVAGVNSAFFWTESLGMMHLKTYLESHGATGLDGWSLWRAFAVSFDGTSIVGMGFNPSGDIEAWLARIPPLTDAIGTNYCSPALPNSTGSPASILATGSPFVASNNVTLTASDLPPGEFGYFLVGSNQGIVMPPGSQGLICLACGFQGCSGIGRFNRAHQIIVGPTGSLQIDLTALPLFPAQSVQPGETWNFQCWFRDVHSSNFTDAVSVTFQ